MDILCNRANNACFRINVHREPNGNRRIRTANEQNITRSVIVMLLYCSTTLLYYSTIMLLYSTIMLLYSTIMLLNYYTHLLL